MALRTRRAYYNLDVGIDTTQIVAASKMVSQITGFAVQLTRPWWRERLCARLGHPSGLAC
jgi:isopropylmalate/homocitrate/citramalate synthase